MKKLIVLIGILSMLLFSVLCCSGCNKQVVDVQYKFDYAIIELPNGEIVEGKVESWGDYEGEQLQVKIGGVTYLTNSYRCTLIAY